MSGHHFRHGLALLAKQHIELTGEVVKIRPLRAGYGGTGRRLPQTAYCVKPDDPALARHLWVDLEATLPVGARITVAGKVTKYRASGRGGVDNYTLAPATLQAYSV